MKKRRIVLNIIEVILFLLIVFSLYKIYSYYKDINQSKEDYIKIEKIVKDIEIENKNHNSDDVKKTNREILKELKKINKDIVGYIDIEDLDISYPVLKGENNDSYLRRNFKKEYSIAGSIFMDEKNKSNMKDQNTIIYGHNMRNGTMFGRLKELKNKDFLDKKIRYITEDRTYIYEIFSYLELNEYDKYRTPNVDSNRWIDFLNWSKSKSLIDFGDFVFDENTRVLALSTCTSKQENRDVVQAILIDEY